MEKDELGQDCFIDNYSFSKNSSEIWESLTDEQKCAVRLLRNVTPINPQDDRFNLITAMNVAKNKGLDRVRKAILVYQQRVQRGDRPKVLGAYLMKIINEGFEPMPEHADENKEAWLKVKGKFPDSSYDERWDNVVFHFEPYRELSFRMSPEVFNSQLKKAMQDLKDRR